MIYGTTEVAEKPSHKCQNNIDADTGECAVCGDDALLREVLAEYAHNTWCGWMQYMFSKCAYDMSDKTRTVPDWAVKRWTRQASTAYVDLPEEEKNSDREEADKILDLIKVMDKSDDEWMNAPMGSPDEPVTPPDWRGESCHNQWDAPPDAPTCHNSDCQCYDTNEAGNCCASDEFGELVPISECHDAILSPPSDAPEDGEGSYEWNSDYTALQIKPPDAPPKDVPMRLPDSWQCSGVVKRTIAVHADTIELIESGMTNLNNAIEKMQRELEVGRANDRYFNEKLDYIGEMKEEIQKHIDTEFDAADKTYENREENRIQHDLIKQQIDSHTTITHGEIERRLTDMGQQIEDLRKPPTEEDVRKMLPFINEMREKFLGDQVVDIQGLQQQIGKLENQDDIDGQKFVKIVADRIAALEQRIIGEKGEE